MLDKKQRRRLTDAQRERIMSSPGVVVHKRTQPLTDPFYVPKLCVRTPNTLTASDLIDGEDDDRTERV